MKPYLVHGKRARPAGLEPAPVPKRARSAEASSVLPPQASGLSPAQLEALRLVEYAFERRSPFLDLSLLDPAVVQGLPFATASRYVGRVKSLQLPPAMQCLPLLCVAMPGLEALHVPQFEGTVLDLSGLRALRRLSGSAGAALREIHAGVDVAIDLPTEQKLHKVRVWRYHDGLQVQQHALPSHAYYKTLPGEALPNFQRINGQASFVDGSGKIVCRHLGMHVLERLLSEDFDPFSTPGYCGLTGAAQLPQEVAPEVEGRFDELLRQSRRYHFVDDAGFAGWCVRQFLEMEALETLQHVQGACAPGATIKKGFMAVTRNHALACVLAIKPGPLRQYAAVLYDPNPGLTHQRRVANGVAEVEGRAWRFSEQLDPAISWKYFQPGQLPLLCFIEPERRKSGEPPRIHYALEEASWPSPDLFLGAMVCNLSACVADVGRRLLDGYRAGKLPAGALFTALGGARAANFKEWSALMSANNGNDAGIVGIVMDTLHGFLREVREREVAGGTANDGLPAGFHRSMLRELGGWNSVTQTSWAPPAMALEALCERTLRMLREGLLTTAEALDLPLPAAAGTGQNAFELALVHGEADNLAVLGRYLTALFDTGNLDFATCLALLDGGTEAVPLALQACKDGHVAALDAWAELLTALATREASRQSAFDFPGLDNPIVYAEAFSGQVLGLVMGKLEPADVAAMAQDPEHGAQFEGSLERLVARLENAGLLGTWHALSRLRAEAMPPTPPLAKPASGDGLFDDGFLADDWPPF